MQRETLKLVTIFYWVEGQQAPAKVPLYPTPRVVIKVPTPFRYISDKVVSWNYTNQIVSQESQAVRVSPKKKQDPSVNDIVRTGRMTCSGRCYASDFSREKEWEGHVEHNGVKVTISKKKNEEPRNELVTEAEANEFFKFIKHNEYSIVEQLHKLPTKISLLALMLNSEPHREAMLKVLKQAYVSRNASIDKIDRLVGNIMMDN